MFMRVLVTGRGSIAQRHVRLLRELVPALELAIISSNGEVDAMFLPCTVLGDMRLGMGWKPDAVVIASISIQHAEELTVCLQAGIPCLVEKPLVTDKEQLASLRALLRQTASPPAVVVGCNLRYLPALQKLRAEFTRTVASTVIRASLEVGHDLLQWRPSREVQTTYSAIASLGGGVIFDLVHEIDMARWLLGPLQVHGAIGGHLSALPIQADDVHMALLKMANGAPVVVSLDYVSQQPVRKYVLVTGMGTFVVDLIEKRITLLTRDEIRVIAAAADDFAIAKTYRFQMTDWLAAIENPAHQVKSSLEDALVTSELMLGMQDAMT